MLEHFLQYRRYRRENWIDKIKKNPAAIVKEWSCFMEPLMVMNRIVNVEMEANMGVWNSSCRAVFWLFLWFVCFCDIFF